MSTRVGAIDCGTNSIRLLVADVDGDSKTDLRRDMRIVRLGQDVDRTGRLAPEAIERTLAACREYRDAMNDLGVQKIDFAATSATRDAENAAEFSAAIFEVLGVNPRVLTGGQEAAASFLGAAREFSAGTTLVVDIGGGSTEFVQGNFLETGPTPTFARSVDLGCVRMTERFLATDPPSEAEIAACTQTIDEVIVPVLDQVAPSDTLVMVAGTATSIAAHALGLDEYDSERIHGSSISFADMSAVANDLLSRSVAQRMELGFMHPGRADVIGGGSLIASRILHHVRGGLTEVVVSEHDILDGIALGAGAVAAS